MIIHKSFDKVKDLLKVTTFEILDEPEIDFKNGFFLDEIITILDKYQLRFNWAGISYKVEEFLFSNKNYKNVDNKWYRSLRGD